jgi:hypothetical protein
MHLFQLTQNNKVNQINKAIAQIDIDNLTKIGANIEIFMQDMATSFARPGTRVLDFAPQDHKSTKLLLTKGIEYQSLDIEPKSGARYIVRLCNCVNTIGYESYDCSICPEVFEHTRQPFDAVNNIIGILKTGRLAFVSTPLNFRKHGPLSDCWRFTEHALRELFKSFEIVQQN